ncbi:hypothetical protein KY363_01770, partial [Candidatus Woesearchaeota archaeon]|nr:hypothetical protein [Candidatus Woesearchaeota archaeon]
MVNKKIFIASIVLDEHEAFLEPFWKAVQAQEFREFEVLFVDCSSRESMSSFLQKTGAKIDKGTTTTRTRELMVLARKGIVNRFLKSGCSHLLFLDPDILLPDKALSRLLFHDKDIVSGTYLFNAKVGEKFDISPCLYSFAGNDSVRLMERREVLENRLVEIACAGLGCTLASRRVIDTLGSGAFGKGSLGDDIAFFVNARDAGFYSYADTSVKCNRLVKPESDRTNDSLSFDAYPKLRNPKVLIGCVTHDKDEQYVEEFLEHIRSQDYTNFDILFAETSGNKEFIAQLRGTNSIVLECFNGQEHGIQKITDGRNAVREYAISKGYDHVWFVDTDIRPPPSSLSKLLSDRKDIVTGLYLDWVNIEGKNRVMPIVYDYTDENEYCRPMWLNDVVGKEGLMEIFFAGFGCTLA